MKSIFTIIGMVVAIGWPALASGASPSPSPAVTVSPTAAPIATPGAGDLWINEFLPNPAGSDTGAEWVELKNVTSKSLAIGGVKVKRLSGTTLATVPSGVTLGAGDVYLVNATGSMVNGGDTLELWLEPVKLDQVTYYTAEDDLAWVRLSATEGAWSDSPSPGAQNPSDVSNGGGDSATDPSSASTRAPTLGSGAGSRRTQSAASRRRPLPKGGMDTAAFGLPALLATLYAWRTRNHAI